MPRKRKNKKENVDQKEKCKKWAREDKAGLFIPAGCLIGVGLGLVYGRPDAGVLIGLGAGFLLMAIIKLLQR